VTTANDITIREALDLLDGPFVELADGVAEDFYALWLGSGISLSRMPGLGEVAMAVLDHLQHRVEVGNAACPYRNSLEAILGLVGLTPDERTRVDFTKQVATWPDIGNICSRMVLHYARALDQAPAGQPADYLVWEAVDVVGRYGDPTKTPAVEHLAVAALIAEGVASDIATANWDALVERATETLLGSDPAILQVRVRPEDVRGGPARAYLYKFHGCAVLAGQDEAAYRSRLVGRASQVNGWEKKAENRVFARKLIDLALSKRTLMLGLSAQDANIQTIFVAASEDMAWEFPSHPPAFVFSEDHIGVDQRGLLRNVYKEQYDPNQAAIDQEALLRAYARSLLPALWLYVVCAKLSAMIDAAAPDLNHADHTLLRNGLKLLRNSVANAAPPTNYEGFLADALVRVGRAMTLFREGRQPSTGVGPYSPLSPSPTAATLADPGLAASGIRQFALGLGLLGLGQAAGQWTCTAPSVGFGTMRVTSPARSAEIFFAANAAAATNLVLNGWVSEDQDAIVLHSQRVLPSAPRSPAGPLGRTGRLGLREINVGELAEGAVELDEMLARLKAEMVV